MTLRAHIEGLTGRGVRDAWGALVTYASRAGWFAELVAVFDEAAELVEDLDGGQITTTGPVLDVLLADLPGEPEEGDTWEIGGVVYRVTRYAPDGSGGATLYGVLA